MKIREFFNNASFSDRDKACAMKMHKGKNLSLKEWVKILEKDFSFTLVKPIEKKVETVKKVEKKPEVKKTLAKTESKRPYFKKSVSTNPIEESKENIT